ncbi:uncharacterized protein SCDLUD_004971 [Saccharomycodes ludwigii]|uniref:uncharacterized protein n=1 Tax=Saccharomycodes ludwigii TaxID=36035 RepID=UPI001E86C45B|nr:hypothetical protein SCDLUD_004971 [Saccharomycodes ludwigii]KAH3898649.1 hypothetical protein SCDLUD_004971 [Saccharomycodes ludwigii]
MKMDFSSTKEFSRADVCNFIAILSQIINHSIEFRPEFTRKNEKADKSKKQYILPVLISDPLKLSGGCLPKFVIELYKENICKLNAKSIYEQDYYLLNEYHSKKIYMNRQLSVSEYGKLHKVATACFYTLYKCVLDYNEMEGCSEKRYIKINKYIDAAPYDTNFLNTSPQTIFKSKNGFQNDTLNNKFQEQLFLTENRFSRIFKSFVGVTFKEYENFCFQTLKENHAVLKPYIDVISELNCISDHNIWKELADELLDSNNFKNNNDISDYSNVTHGVNAVINIDDNICPINHGVLNITEFTTNNVRTGDNCNILLPQTFSLQNYTSFSDNKSRKNTKIRKKLLLKKIPKLQPEFLIEYKYHLAWPNINSKIEKLKAADSEHHESKFKTHSYGPKVYIDLTGSDTFGRRDINTNNKVQNTAPYKTTYLSVNDVISNKFRESSRHVANITENLVATNSINHGEWISESNISVKNGTSDDKINNEASDDKINNGASDDKINNRAYYNYNRDSSDFFPVSNVKNTHEYAPYTYCNSVNYHQQQLNDLDFQASYKSFCLGCKGAKVYHENYEKDDNNYRAIATENPNNHGLENTTIVPPNLVSRGKYVSNYFVSKTTSDVIREMLSNKEKQ